MKDLWLKFLGSMGLEPSFEDVVRGVHAITVLNKSPLRSTNLPTACQSPARHRADVSMVQDVISTFRAMGLAYSVRFRVRIYSLGFGV